MKANVPKKLYYAPYGDIREDYPITDNDIEYTRTDAFIERACSWLRTHSEADYFELIPDANYCGAGNINKKRMIDEFRKYMKGEEV
jgi:hypothetical protein